MKKYLYFLAAGLMIASCSSNKAPKLDDPIDSISWVLGRSTAENLMSGPFKEIDKELFIQAVRATLDGDAQPISDSVYHETLDILMRVSQIAAVQQTDQQAQEVDRQQQEYFAKLVADNPDVKQHPSGFYYQVIKKGTGDNAKYASLIAFDYRSFTMLDGKPFDQTYGNNDTVRHLIDESIMPGLLDGLCNMRAGSTYRFYFPSELAFGAKGTDGIPPYSTVIYEIALYAVTDL